MPDNTELCICHSVEELSALWAAVDVVLNRSFELDSTQARQDAANILLNARDRWLAAKQSHGKLGDGALSTGKHVDTIMAMFPKPQPSEALVP